MKGMTAPTRCVLTLELIEDAFVAARDREFGPRNEGLVTCGLRVVHLLFLSQYLLYLSFCLMFILINYRIDNDIVDNIMNQICKYNK